MNKIHKLVIKKLKLNLNCHIKTSKNTTFFKFNNAY